MDFKSKSKEVLLVIKEKLIIAGKWIKKTSVLCWNKIKEISILVFTTIKDFFIEVKEVCIAKKNGTPVKNESKAHKSTKSSQSKIKKENTIKNDLEETSGFTDSTLELTEAIENQTDEEKKKRRVLTILGIIIILILLFLLFGGIRSCTNSSKSRTKENVCNMATKYAGRGEFDRALDKLDSYLEKYGDDDDVWELLNKIIDLKNANGGKDSVGDVTYPDNFTFDLDTSDLSSAMKDALEESRKQAEESRKAMEELLKLQNQQNANLNGNGSLSPEEAERKAMEQAAAEQKRLQEEKKKAEEEAIAKQNAELKNKIDAVNAEIQKGKDALAKGKTDEAIKYFNNALAIMPDVPGNPNFGAGKESEIAQALYDAAQNATNPAEKEKLMNQAVNYANNVINQNPNDAAAHNILAQNALAKKDYNTALKELQEAASVKEDVNRYLYYYNLGKVQYILKKYSDAATSFKTSCDLKSDFAPSRYNLGITQKQLKNETAALDAFRKTVQIDPNHDKAYLEQARILASRGDYLGAIDAYKAVLRVNTVNSAAARELGDAYYKRKNYNDAIDSYQRALTMLSPGEEMTLTKYNLSTVLYDAGRVDEAVKYAKEAYDSKESVKNKDSKANIVYNYGLMLDKTDKVSAAISVYAEVLKLNPNHTKTKINLGNMYMASSTPQLDQALQLFKEVYNTEPTNFEANNNLGTVYLEKSDYLNSIKYYQNAMKIQPKNIEVRANLAKAYAKNGEYESSKVTYEDLIKLDANNWDSYIELAKVCMQLNQNSLADEYLSYVQENNPSYRKSEINNLKAAISN